jgi:Trp operon repressor
MGKTAQLWADRIDRIDRAGFWPFVTKYFNGRGWPSWGIRGAYYVVARQRWRSCAHLLVQSMTPILLALVWKLLLPALLIVALVDVLTQSRSQRIRRLHCGGLSQRSIASRLGVSRYQVQKALA